jgi:hypothetical protein
VQFEKAFEPVGTDTVFGMTAEVRLEHPLKAFEPRTSGVKKERVLLDWSSDAAVLHVSWVALSTELTTEP